MAKLSANGRTQVAEARFTRSSGKPDAEGHHTLYRLMSDGTVLQNLGYGWTVFTRKRNLAWFHTFSRGASAFTMTRG